MSSGFCLCGTLLCETLLCSISSALALVPLGDSKVIRLQAGPCRLSFAWPAGHARVKPTLLTLAYVQVK